MNCIHKISSTILSALLLSNCQTVGPDYALPEIQTPKSWSTSATITENTVDKNPLNNLHSFRAAKQSGIDAIGWWRHYNDPVLSRLIEAAREANPNLHRVQARVSQAWHQRKVLRAAFFPHADANGRVDYGLGDFNSDGVHLAAGDDQYHFAQIDAGWEVDLWGRIKRQVEGVNADYEASVEGLRDAVTFVTAEVALHYTAIRTLESRIMIVENATKEFATIENIVRIRKEEGLSARVDLAEATARLRTEEAQLPTLAKQIQQLKNRLATLIGKYPGEVDQLLSSGRGIIPTPPTRIATGLPNDLLRERPDVRRAERQIAAETARVGVRIANLYPQLSISGAITYEANISNSVTNIAKRTLGLGPKLRWRLFHACADRARIEEQKKMVEMTINNYEATVLNAVLDVENSLTRISHEQKCLRALQAASMAHKTSADLSRESYELGIIDLRRLLNSHRDYYFTKGESLASQGRLVAHSVKLFKALGGGETLYNYFHEDDEENERIKNESQFDALTSFIKRG